MKKYYLIARNMWDQIFTYRLNFSVWRVRQVAKLLTLYFLWDAILGRNQTILGYTHTTILTYVLLGSFLDAIVFSSQSFGLADEINNGDLSNFLLRPLNYFLYWAAKDIGDKTMNIMFFIIEFSLFVILLKPPFFLQKSALFILGFILSVFLAVILFFFCSIILGMIGFWSSESWAPRFLFIILLNFFAGGLFPLNMLPNTIYTIFRILPFSYLYYFPLRVYLGQVSFSEILYGWGTTILWIGICFIIARTIWQKGLRAYTAQGR